MPKWLKRLDALAPRHKGQSLDKRIYEEILKKAEGYTPEKKDEFEENFKLFSELVKIHRVFEEEDIYPQGIFKDIFGEYMIEYNLFNDRAGQILTPYTVVKSMTMMLFSAKEEELKREPQTILDPAAGTGRFMLGVASYYAEKIKSFNFIMTNIDIDHRMFTFCTLNAILHGIPSINIHGDSLAGTVWEGYATIPIPGMRLAQWIRVDAELMKSRLFPPRAPHGQQVLAEYKAPVAIIEVESTVKEEKKPKLLTTFFEPTD